MATINRLRVSWSGSPVTGPGLSTFYFDPATGGGAADDVETFFNAIKTAFPNGISWTIPSNGDQIADSTGELTGVWSAPGEGGVVTSSGGANWAQGVGMRVRWNTAGIYRGRRVKGTTFLVPLLANAYTSDGTLDNAYVSTVQTAAAAMIAANPGFVVWSRPVPVGPGGPATVGESNFVTSASAVDGISWLRSRRT